MVIAREAVGNRTNSVRSMPRQSDMQNLQSKRRVLNPPDNFLEKNSESFPGRVSGKIPEIFLPTIIGPHFLKCIFRKPLF